MPPEASPSLPHGLSRRGLLSAAAVAVGATVASPLLSACSGKKSGGPGTTSKSDVDRALPAYLANNSVNADVPSVTGVNGAISDPCFLSYPTSPVTTVSGLVGSGGSYTTMTPLWGAIPASSGNAYYATVNKAIGATLKLQPSDGNTYGDALPPVFAANKLPDWIMIPGWLNVQLNLGEAMTTQFADLTPYLAGDKAKQYPNLANVPPAAWAAGVWDGKLYGIPSYPSAAVFNGAYFYRKDLLDSAGVSVTGFKSADDLAGLGKELTNAKGGVWAFDDLFGQSAAYVSQLFQFPNHWGIDGSGKLIYKYETEGIVEALNWYVKLVKAGYVHPDAIANNNQNAKQRFWSGKVLIQVDGTGAWDGLDAQSGVAANPGYVRQALPLLSPDGAKPPTIELGNGAAMFSYLNKKLSAAQIKECLAIANYLAAPYGSAEWLKVNFGDEGVDYTMKDGNPVLNAQGNKEVATTFQFLACPPAATVPKNGFTQVAKDYAAWQGDAVKHAVKPLFFDMNIAEPSQYSAINKPVDDTIDDVRFGRKPISAFTDAVDTWRKQGGDALRTFYDGIRSKYGTGQ
ncbi:extracellular solute-binding protein [Rugosimonospora acidiphila]|uniref:Extracellular solute-binding protein n=1 Tax=Rugosimonospora acidiphila TaxID=556531 RepID=A0ABP9SJF4_9ACTN